MRYFITLLIFTSLTSCNLRQKRLQEEGVNTFSGTMEDRFKTTVVNLRQGGLFADYKNLEVEQLTKALIEKAKIKYQVNGYDSFNEVFNLKNNSDFFDLHVAALDETRVWWRDLEADVLDGNNVYAETVKEFGKLSGGFLSPEQIKEEWISANGPVKVSFQDKDSLRVMNLKFNDDWYDEDFFKYLETFMKNNGSPYSFYLHDQTGQDAFLIRLTVDEKERIQKKMNWNLVRF